MKPHTITARIREEHGQITADALGPVIASIASIRRSLDNKTAILADDVDILAQKLDGRSSGAVRGTSLARLAVEVDTLTARLDDMTDLFVDLANAMMASHDADDLTVLVIGP